MASPFEVLRGAEGAQSMAHSRSREAREEPQNRLVGEEL
jgi:hypothetical protein